MAVTPTVVAMALTTALRDRWVARDLLYRGKTWDEMNDDERQLLTSVVTVALQEASR